MFKKIWQIILFIFLISAISIAQISFLPALPHFLSKINLVVIVLMFSLFFFNFSSAVWVALIGGFWLDLVSFNFFGAHIFILFSAAFLTYRISDSWLTNRSLYSFSFLILIATVIFNIIREGLFYLIADHSYFFLFQGGFWLDLLYQCAWSVAAALLMFNLAGILTRRLKPFFLEKRTLYDII
ncbi:MAG: rod shape-determining protein MreD [Patescibacteria group bacterium]|jgi:cell shape-determining protein MreD